MECNSAQRAGLRIRSSRRDPQLLTISPAPQAIELDACIKRSGRVYIIGEEYRRQECRLNDVVTTLSTEEIAGPQGPSGPEGPKGDTGSVAEIPHLVDAAGQDLGPVLFQKGASYETFYWVVNTEHDLMLTFRSSVAENPPVGAADFFPQKLQLYFTTSDCSGNPFVALEGDGWDVAFDQLLTSGPGQWPFYTVARDATPAPRTAGSRNDPLHGGCESQAFGPFELTFEVTEFTSPLPFTEPLAWPLRVRQN